MTRKNDQPDDRPLDEVAAAAEFEGDKGADDGVPLEVLARDVDEED